MGNWTFCRRGFRSPTTQILVISRCCFAKDGNMLQHFGWGWIKFENGQIFVAIFLMLFAFGQLLHISQRNPTVECCNKFRWNAVSVWRDLEVQCGSFIELNFYYCMTVMQQPILKSNGHVLKQFINFDDNDDCVIPDRCVERWKATSRSQWSSGKGT